MNKKEFNVLVEKFGNKVVWYDENEKEFCFSMGEELLLSVGSLEWNNVYLVLDEKLGGDKIGGIKWFLGYGDDVINCVSVKDLKDFEKVEGLEEFVLKWLGLNCYSGEEEYGNGI